jgi:hypothetical protein
MKAQRENHIQRLLEVVKWLVIASVPGARANRSNGIGTFYIDLADASRWYASPATPLLSYPKPQDVQHER